MTTYIIFEKSDPFHQTTKELTQTLFERGVKAFREIHVPPYGNGQWTWHVTPENGCKFWIAVSKDGTVLQNLHEMEKVREMIREQKRCYTRTIKLRSAT